MRLKDWLEGFKKDMKEAGIKEASVSVPVGYRKERVEAYGDYVSIPHALPSDNIHSSGTFHIDLNEDERLRGFLDGNALCIVDKDFVNIEESRCFFVTLTKKELEEYKKTFPEDKGW
ncbi:hypothetical protein IIA15_01015 [candidate division TA06 bacterium]|nr:hypothetical protein [candidate division TA06 bacterium]